MLEQAPLVWGEIPVADMERAMGFYQQQFGLSFKREQTEEMDMAIVECADPQAASIALFKHEMVKPSTDGSAVYLHLSECLSPLLEKLSSAGVQIVVPLTEINGGECGFFSLFIDSEGNRVGLWSKQR